MSKKIDLKGQRFNHWEVLEFDKTKKGKTAHWICRCDCGTIKSVCSTSLRNNSSKSCGCEKAKAARENNGKFINEVGNRYGKLVVLKKEEELSILKHRAYWVCRCDCGNITIVSSKCLRNGHTLSCGCISRSIGEENIEKILKINNINFLSEYPVKIDNKYYRFDFAILKNGKVQRFVEFDGIQHYDEKEKHWGKSNTEIKLRDVIKNNYCFYNKIPLVRIPYTERDNITLDLIFGNKYLLNKEEAQEVEDV